MKTQIEQKSWVKWNNSWLTTWIRTLVFSYLWTPTEKSALLGSWLSLPTFRVELTTLVLPSLQFVNYRSGLLSLQSQLLLSLFICACVGISCFIVLGFIALHRCYIFYKLKARLHQQKDYHSLYCNLLYCGDLELDLQ